MPVEEHRREAARHPVQLQARCRTGSGIGDTIWISDISEYGCCISTNGMLLSTGSRVVVRPVGMEGLTGQIKWSDAWKAGLEFDNPLYVPVLEHLANVWKVSEGE